MKKGFSLAELMIVLAVAGMLAALIIPVITRDIGNTDKILYRSAFKVVESTISEIITNETKYVDGKLTNTSYVLCNDFANTLNTIGTVSCSTASTVPTTAGGTEVPNFVTSNGMRWYGFEDGFTGTPLKMDIWVDVNGKGRGKNYYSSTETAPNDILLIHIYENGKVSTPSTGKEPKYLTE